MVRRCLVPFGWPCKLEECPPGIFWFNNSFGFKDEYGKAGNIFCIDSGEIFWGGTDKKQDRDKLIVQPIIIEEQEE